MKKFIGFTILALATISAFAQQSATTDTANGCVGSHFVGAQRYFSNSCKSQLNVELVYLSDGLSVSRIIPPNDQVQDLRPGSVIWFACRSPFSPVEPSMGNKWKPVSKTTRAYQCVK